MSFLVAGTSYRFSPLEVRERVLFAKKNLRDAFCSLKGIFGLQAFFILSTCNRSEIYLWSDRETDARRIFCGLHGTPEDALRPFLYQLKDEEALRHLFRVMCGLDSQIPGESQIFGQVKQAVRYAEEFGTIDYRAARLINRTSEAAERFRRNTGEGYVSGTLADAALELLRENEPFFYNKRFLLVGTGKVMEQFIPLLMREDIRPVLISNRNHEQAAYWARMLRGSACHLEELSASVRDSDIIISATSCPRTILRREHFSDRSNPALILDLAVPRDAEAAIKDIPGVKLFNLDDVGMARAKKIADGWVDAAERRVRGECEVLWRERSESEREEALLR